MQYRFQLAATLNSEATRTGDMENPLSPPTRRLRIAWWVIVAVLGLLLGWFLVTYVGTFVLGLFFYYGSRPLHRRVSARVGRRGLAAALTLSLIVLPVVALLSYASLVAFQELTGLVGSRVVESMLARLPGNRQSLQILVQSPLTFLTRLEDPARFQGFIASSLSTLGNVANALTHLTLAFTFAFFLLRDGPRVTAWFRNDVADESGVTEAYLEAVDADLQTVYFGNVITVLSVGVTAFAVYHGFNLVAPPVLTIPVPTLLALLTGLATFVPLVVGKLVYLPTAGFLVWNASQTDAVSELFPWLAGFLVASFLFLDLLPMTLVQPYVSGKTLHGGLVLFAYVLGAALFGWYGLFLGPLILVLVAQAANIVLPELLHGEPLRPRSHTAIGSAPKTGDGPVTGQSVVDEFDDGEPEPENEEGEGRT